MRFVSDVKIIGGGLPVFPGTVSSFTMVSAPADSASIGALRGVGGKLRVGTSV
jgi:hypothetical protein